MRALALFAFAAFTTLAPIASAQDIMAASAAYRDLQTICSEDRGRLWGADLCGPLIVVDPATRAAWASESDGGGVFTDTGAGWVGTLPADVAVANTAVEWAGRRWVMLIAPLPESEIERRVLVAHEAWHRAQSGLSFYVRMRGDDPLHLDDEDARVLMRLEFRALATAMRSRGRARRQAGRDALLFRATRFARYQGAASTEAMLFRNEGLASYTGVRLGVLENPDLYAARTLDEFDTHEAYARAFAYAAGPGYGLLLDDLVPAWRTNLGTYSPPDLLLNELRPRVGSRNVLRQARERYGGAEIAAAERQRAEAMAIRLAELRRTYAEGPRLEAPLTNWQMEFNPGEITPIPGVGPLYSRLTMRDDWGVLRAEQGAVIAGGWNRVIVANPDGTGIAGPGWSLILNPGYGLAPAAPGVITIIPVADADQTP